MEGVALAFGLDPDEVVEAPIGQFPRLSAHNSAQHFAEIALEAQLRGDLRESVRPTAFMAWAESVGLAFHDIWTSKLNPRIPAGPGGELETAGETVKRVFEFIDQRDALIEEWVLAPSWTLREGACLANMMHPRLLLGGDEMPSKQPRADRVNLLIEFALRAMRRSELSDAPAPAEFIAWSGTVGFPFDPKWMEAVGEVPSVVRPMAHGATESTLSRERSGQKVQVVAALGTHGHKERTSLLKLVIGMAVQGYKFDPTKSRNEATKDIADDLAQLGIPLDRGTILKWLNEGAELLPRELEDD